MSEMYRQVRVHYLVHKIATGVAVFTRSLHRAHALLIFCVSHVAAVGEIDPSGIELSKVGSKLTELVYFMYVLVHVFVPAFCTEKLCQTSLYAVGHTIGDQALQF
jgi:hypothetical protein